MTNCGISCELHDYIEIACLYGYRLRLELDDHRVFEGKAIDTLTSADKCEYLIIDDGQQRHLPLSALKKMKVLTADAPFSEVYF